jgi:hypothetical protein
VQTLVVTFIFSRLGGRKCKRVPSGVPNKTNPNFLPVGEGFGFVVFLNEGFEQSNRNMPGAYCCQWCKMFAIL